MKSVWSPEGCTLFLGYNNTVMSKYIQLSQVMNMLKTSPVGATEPSTGASPVGRQNSAQGQAP